jgi:hypothetical protein
MLQEYLQSIMKAQFEVDSAVPDYEMTDSDGVLQT